MRYGLIAWLTMISLLAPTALHANTWDEPWHKEVVAGADTLGLYHVESVDGNTARVTLKKHVTGSPTPEQVELAGYFLFRVTSSPSNNWSPWLKPGVDYYLYLKQASPGKWQLPTPSAGSDPARADGTVEATYRISIHKASVSQDIYEMTQSCIFAALHEGRCGRSDVQRLIDDLTSQPVAAISANASPEDKQRFFEQHAALETAALAKLPISDRDVERFLKSDFFHVQISAVRYLASSERPDRYATISAFICDQSKSTLARIVGVILLAENNARSERSVLTACRATLKLDDVSLVRGLMDPRIGTNFPGNLQSAADRLLERWESN
jgi:hypothetical protein